jgi:hypothetical protein
VLHFTGEVVLRISLNCRTKTLTARPLPIKVSIAVSRSKIAEQLRDLRPNTLQLFFSSKSTILSDAASVSKGVLGLRSRPRCAASDASLFNEYGPESPRLLQEQIQLPSPSGGSTRIPSGTKATLSALGLDKSPFNRQARGRSTSWEGAGHLAMIKNCDARQEGHTRKPVPNHYLVVRVSTAHSDGNGTHNRHQHKTLQILTPAQQGFVGCQTGSMEHVVTPRELTVHARLRTGEHPNLDEIDFVKGDTHSRARYSQPACYSQLCTIVSQGKQRGTPRKNK